MIFFPNAKINIGLDILRRRDDGFHDIETVMVPLSGLCDVLEIVPSGRTGISFTQSGTPVDCPPEMNLCVKAYGLLAERYDIGGVKVHLHKGIPFGAGLGGGSADAAFTLKGLDKLFSLGLTAAELERLAGELGSDTVFFIRNTPQLAEGRGERLTPFDLPLAGKSVVIVKPEIAVSTREAYSGVHPHTLPVSLRERLTGDLSAWHQSARNAFEAHIFARYPLLKSIKEKLYEAGALYAAMSGSGSALFGIFDTPRTQKKCSAVPQIGDLLGTLGDDAGELFVYQQVMS